MDNRTPAFYAVNPDEIVDALWQRFEAKFKAMQGGDKWLKTREAAERLSLSPDQVLRLIDGDVLPATNFASPGATRAEWRIKESDIVNFKR